MFTTSMILLCTLIFGFVQIAMFKSFPRFLKNICAYYILLGMFINFSLSSLILMFTGVASLVGIANLGGSVLLGIYLELYKRHHEIKGIKISWRLGIIPTIHFIEGNKVNSWIF